MQQRGFTLIELIIVIVILGILAVTAAPRFIDFQGDARASTLQGLKAALQGGSQLVYAKAAIAGQQNAEGATVSITDSGDVTADFGYPEAESMTFANVSLWADIDANDWVITLSTATPGPDENSTAFTPDGVAYTATEADACQVIYTESSGPGVSPVIEVQSEGC